MELEENIDGGLSLFRALTASSHAAGRGYPARRCRSPLFLLRSAGNSRVSLLICKEKRKARMNTLTVMEESMRILSLCIRTVRADLCCL